MPVNNKLQSFEHYWHAESIQFVRGALLFALFNLIALGFFDTAYLKEGAGFLLRYRAIVLIPLCLAALWISFSRWQAKVHWFSAALCIAANVGFARVFLLVGPWAILSFLGATVQTFVFLYWLFRVPFKLALLAAIAVLLSYLVPVALTELDPTEQVMYLFWGTVAFGMCVYSSWSRERQARQLYQARVAADEATAQLIQEKDARLNALRDITHYLAHEIRSQVAVARGALAIKQGAAHLERTNHSLDSISEILDSVSNATSLADAIKCEKKRRFDFSATVRTVVSDHGPGIKPTHIAAPVELYGNQLRIKQMLCALLDNAVSFSHSGSEVEVCLQRTPDVEYRLTVSNRGNAPDIPLEDLLEPWRSGRRSPATCGQHLGLGLFVVKTVAQAHHAKVLLDHCAGRTTFSVIFPAN